MKKAYNPCLTSLLPNTIKFSIMQAAVHVFGPPPFLIDCNWRRHAKLFINGKRVYSMHRSASNHECITFACKDLLPSLWEDLHCSEQKCDFIKVQRIKVINKIMSLGFKTRDTIADFAIQKEKNLPDLTSHQICSLRSLLWQAPSPMLMEIARAAKYGQWELYQIQLQNNPLFGPICSNKMKAFVKTKKEKDWQHAKHRKIHNWKDTCMLTHHKVYTHIHQIFQYYVGNR